MFSLWVLSNHTSWVLAHLICIYMNGSRCYWTKTPEQPPAEEWSYFIMLALCWESLTSCLRPFHSHTQTCMHATCLPESFAVGWVSRELVEGVRSPVHCWCHLPTPLWVQPIHHLQHQTHTYTADLTCLDLTDFIPISICSPLYILKRTNFKKSHNSQQQQLNSL